MRRAEIERLLPEIFQLALHPVEGWVMEPDRRLAAALEAMEVLHDPCERILDTLESHIDPRRAPPAFVSYLAGWLDLDWLVLGERQVGDTEPPDLDRAFLSTGLGRLREIVALSMYLSRWRGTARGLLRFLRTATGVSTISLEEEPTDPAGGRRPFHVRIVAPADAREHAALIERIVLAEKPAFMTYEVSFAAP
jgi:phage tail-like protein